MEPYISNTPQYYYSNFQYASQPRNMFYMPNEMRNSNYYSRRSYYNYSNPPYMIINNSNVPYQNVDFCRGNLQYVPVEKYELFTKIQLNQLRAQINVYKLLIKALPLPESLAVSAYGGYEKYEKKFYSHEETAQSNSGMNDDITESKPSIYGVNPIELMKNRENRIDEKINKRIHLLSNKIINKSCDRKQLIELKSLRLLKLQKKIRSDILNEAKSSTSFSNMLNMRAYARTKKQTLRDSRYCEKSERYLLYEKEKLQKQKHQEFLNVVIQHGKDFREFHRVIFFKIAKINKSIMNYFNNNQKCKRKEQEKIEKERMRRLMAEDEEGYRKLIDEKKDMRLHFLLSQTDEFIASLTSLVKEHKKEQVMKKDLDIKKRKLQTQLDMICKILQKKYGLSYNECSKICNDSLYGSGSKATHLLPKDVHIDVYNPKTNRKLVGSEAPTFEIIFCWLKENSVWEIAMPDVPQETSTDCRREDSRDSDICSATVETTDGVETAAISGGDDDEYNKNQSYYTHAHSIQESIGEQSSLMVNGTMKEYQIQGLEWLVSLYNNNLNGILADEMGLGKTIQTIGLVTYLMEKKKVNGPFLIIVPLSTVSNWALEFDKWAPSVIKILYKGSPNSRKTFQVLLKSGKFNVLLTTYEYIIKDKSILSKVSWKYIIIDEGHRMKNHHCKLTQILNAHYDTSYRLLLTGTPLQNKLPELWALLNFLLPNIFHSVSTFEQWFNAPFANSGERVSVELNQEETLLIIRRLHKVLRPFLLRRLKKEVENQLPDKVEYVLKCEMSALQRTLYSHMQSKGVILTDESNNDKKGNGGSRTLMNTIMQLRKICNHPFMFQHIEQAVAENNMSMLHKDKKKTVTQSTIDVYGPDLFRVSGKFELLDRILPKLKATNHRVLIFCQMTTLMSIMATYFEYRGFKYLRLDGSTKSDDRGELLALFNNPNHDYFIFMLSTRAGGLGLNLQTADTVVIFDSDWNPHLDLQAQDRAHRIGQKNEVRVLRLITNNSVEEKILAAARFKLNVDEKVIQAGMFDQKSTGSERRQFLQALLNQDEQDDHSEDECPDDETINQMIARFEEEFETYQKMDIDRVYGDNKNCSLKTRLMTYDEMPNWIIKSDHSIDQDIVIPEISDTSHKRIRKEVDYSDSLTESQLVKHFISDDEETATVSKVPKKKKIKLNQKPSDTSTNEVTVAVKIEKITPNTEKKKRKVKPPVMLDTIAAESKRRNKDFLTLINTLLELKEENGRMICDPFVRLPSKRDLPDYYEIIKIPMDFVRIKHKLRESKYNDIEDLNNDINLLCNNAQVYNMDGSLIFEDSKLIAQKWQQITEEFSINYTGKILKKDIKSTVENKVNTSMEIKADEIRVKLNIIKSPMENSNTVE